MTHSALRGRLCSYIDGRVRGGFGLKKKKKKKRQAQVFSSVVAHGGRSPSLHNLGSVVKMLSEVM